MQNEYTQISDPGNWRYNTYKWSHNPTCNGRCIATKPSISCLFLPGNSCHRSFGTCLPTWSSTIALALGCFGCLGLRWWFQGLRCQNGQVSPLLDGGFKDVYFYPCLGKWCDLKKYFSNELKPPTRNWFSKWSNEKPSFVNWGKADSNWRVGYRFLPMNDGQRQNFGKQKKTPAISPYCRWLRNPKQPPGM